MKWMGLWALLCVAFGSLAWGGDSAIYPNGLEGVKAASLPPAGIYFRNYEAWYHATDIQDAHGKSAPVDFRGDVFVSAQRLIYVTDKTESFLGGADYACHLILPVQYMDIRMGKTRDNNADLGDINVAPLILAWHKDRFDFAVDYEFFAPTASYEPNRMASVGTGYWTHMTSFGGTVYADSEKTVSVSALGRYEFNGAKRNANYTPGQQVHFEWGVGKLFPSVGVEIGVAGYCSWQTTDDSGKGVTWDKTVHDRVYAAGPEVWYTIKPIGLRAGLRYNREFLARDHTQGNMTTLMFTKRF